MKRFLSLMLVAVAACSNDGPDPLAPPVDPPSVCVDCGRTDLALIAAEIIWPGAGRIVYSGDTVQVQVRVQNRGTVPSDTSTHVTAGPARSDGGGSVHIGSIAAGATVTDTILMIVALVNHDTASFERLHVHLYNFDTDTTYNNNSAVIPYSFTPTYMRLTGPDTIRIDQTYDFTLRIINPSPRALRPASIGVCLEAPQCRGGVFLRLQGPNVPGGTTAEVPLQVRVPNSPALEFLSGYWAPHISACYGYPGASYECGWRRVTLLPP